MNPLRIVAGAAAIALLAVGCGKEESGPSAAEYTAAADRLCLRAQERVEELDDDFQDFDDVKLFAANAAKIGDALLTDLKNLEVPDELAEKVDEFNGEFTNGMRLIRRLGKAAEDEDEGRIEEIAEEVEDQDKRLEALAEDIGYEECGIPDEDEDEDEDAAADDPAEEEPADEEPADDVDAGDDDDADEAAADEPPVTLDDIQDALEAEGIEFLATDDVASLEQDSDPPPFESAAFETDDGSAIFEILVYSTSQEARDAKAGINAAAGCGDEGSTTVCAGVGNAILVIDGDGATVEEIGAIFTETMRSA
jgi:hypothetical protein